MSEQTCPHCGGEMKAGGFAIACGPDGSVDIPLPATCPSRQCQADRSEAAMQRAIEQGVIDP